MRPPEPGWGHLKRKDEDPVFDEPWQAQALAMADLLIKSGRISGSVWTETLGAEILAAKSAGKPDHAETFFQSVLSALARVLAENGNVTEADLSRRQRQWESAYLHTPHGQPVALHRS